MKKTGLPKDYKPAVGDTFTSESGLAVIRVVSAGERITGWICNYKGEDSAIHTTDPEDLVTSARITVRNGATFSPGPSPGKAINAEELFRFVLPPVKPGKASTEHRIRVRPYPKRKFNP
ncbi:hypothetical protein OpiT1DRAFT_00015 [Opitutaceae bacterium TAV1]|nr:hypothetical protein OpiT1DRAFT_00015 [Opitutaceae bacterium TAV1]